MMGMLVTGTSSDILKLSTDDLHYTYLEAVKIRNLKLPIIIKI